MIQNARMIMKRGNGKPTVPASNDNNDGTWVATDIYEGEQYMDLDTGIVYTRSGSSLLTVVAPKGIYKANISQDGTDAPVVSRLHVNTLGTVSWSRQSTGTYLFTATGKFTSAPFVQITAQNSSGLLNAFFVWGILDANTIRIVARDTLNVLQDDLLDNTSIVIEIW